MNVISLNGNDIGHGYAQSFMAQVKKEHVMVSLLVGMVVRAWCLGFTLRS